MLVLHELGIAVLSVAVRLIVVAATAVSGRGATTRVGRVVVIFGFLLHFSLSFALLLNTNESRFSLYLLAAYFKSALNFIFFSMILWATWTVQMNVASFTLVRAILFLLGYCFWFKTSQTKTISSLNQSKYK